jgi:translation initiation factor RLI1
MLACLSVAGKVPVLNVSYKPQKISPKSTGTVRQLLHEKIRDSYIHPQFVTDVLKPLQVDSLMDQEVSSRVWHKRVHSALELHSTTTYPLVVA